MEKEERTYISVTWIMLQKWERAKPLISTEEWKSPRHTLSIFHFPNFYVFFFSRHIKSGIPYSRSKDKNNHFPSNVNRSTIFIFSFSSALILATLKLICKTVCVCDIKGDERFFPASQKSLFHRPLTWNGKQRKTENGKAWKGVNDVTANQPSQQNENFP